MTLSEAEGHFLLFYAFEKPITQEIQHVLYTVCLCITWKVHPACDLNFIVKGEKLLKLTGSHVHWKSVNISETVLDKDVVKTGH